MGSKVKVTKLRAGLLTTVMLIATCSASAAVYKCVEAGRTTYRDQPCPNGSINDTMTVRPNTVEKIRTPTMPDSERTPVPQPKKNVTPNTNTSAQAPKMPSDAELIAKCKADRGAFCDSDWMLAKERDKITPQTVPLVRPPKRRSTP